ncbi:MAG: hypothetical protein HOP29_14500 [Phycisphaerales bacterium]|nr:hypothetical protein [Phycisphaerales bacterium]
MLGAVANHIAIHFDDAPDIPTGSASNEGTILVTRTAQETSLTKQQEDDVARNEIARRHAKMFQGLGDKFTELAGRAETAKMSHLEHDFGAALLQAATLLNAAADAGLLPDWERERSWILNTTGPFAHVIEGFLGTPGHERTCRLWTFAIQRQIKKHPGLFHPDASQLDWQHVRIDASVAPIITYFAASELRSMAPGRREALRIWTAKLRAKGILPPGRRVFKEWSRPPDAFVEDESALGEPDGDEADQRHRIKLRAEACSTACGLFRDQIVVASPPGASAGAMNGTDPIDDHRNTIREGEAIPLESDATPIMKTDGAPNGGEAELTESDAKLKLWNSLTDRQRNCMIALRELKALDAESLQDASKIAVKAEGSQQNRSGFKVPLSDLVHRKLAASKLGWKGGYWLTRRGDELLSAVTHD